MGFLDKLIKGAQIIGEIASEVSNAKETSAGTTQAAPYVPEKSFEEKIKAALHKVGDYELRSNISPDDLEQEFGKEIYSHKGCKRPENITYGVYQDGNRILLIRLWMDYGLYNRQANRQIKEFCDKNHVKMLDFFAYLPNEESYMDQRIRASL